MSSCALCSVGVSVFEEIYAPDSEGVAETGRMESFNITSRFGETVCEYDALLVVKKVKATPIVVPSLNG